MSRYQCSRLDTVVEMGSTGVSLSQLRQHGLISLLKKAQTGTNEKIVIDYSSPNIAKRFHVGNLRSTLIGRYTAKLNSIIGNDVTSINYLGDWGRQMALIIAYWPKVRPSDSYWNSVGDGEKVRLLTDCYVVGNRMMESDEQLREDVRRIHERMEQMKLKGEGDNNDEEMKQWKDIVNISISHLNHFYSLFDCQFTKWMGESEESGRAQLLVSDLLSKKHATTDEKGTIITDRDAFHRLGRSDGTTLYLTRDISSLLFRDQLYKADKYIYVVERAQRNHFANLKRVMELIGYEDLAAKIIHLSYGRVKGLSTRKGRTEVVEEIMESGKELAKEFMGSSPTAKELTQDETEEISLKLAISSLVVTEMRRARNSDYEFSWRRTFDPSGGNNALFLHSKYSRLCSIEETNRDMMNGLNVAPTLPAIPILFSFLEWSTMKTNINSLFLAKIMKESTKVSSSDMFDHIRNRRLFSRKVLPMGIRGDNEAKMVVDSLVPHERRFLYDQLRRRMVEQYTESSDRVTAAAVPNHEMVSLWYVYFIPSIAVGLVSTTILIFVGEGIDRSVGHVLGLSILGSAAMGNMLSNVSNLFLARYMEPLIGFIGIKRPMLSIDQWQCRTTVFVVNSAKVLGVVFGSIIGMGCLLVIDSPHRSDMEHDDEKGVHEELEYDYRRYIEEHEPSRRKDDEDGDTHGQSA